MAKKKYLSVKETADRLNKTEEAVRALCRDGVIQGAFQKRKNAPWQIPISALSDFDLAAAPDYKQKSGVFRNAIKSISLLSSILIFAFALISALADISAAERHLYSLGRFLGLDPLQANENETLVLITNFNGDENIDIESRIFRELKERVSESELKNVRIELLKEDSPVSEEAAAGIGMDYRATIIIWGTVDSLGIEPRYTIVKNEDNIVNKPELGIVTASDLPDFSAYVVKNVPNQFEYIMLFSLGQIAYFNKEYEKSIGLFSDAIKIGLSEQKEKLNIGSIFFYRGFANRVVENWTGALADFTDAIKYNSDDAYAYSLRGNILSDMGRYEEALLDHNRSIEINPSEYGFYINRGGTYSYAGKIEDALNDFNYALEQKPDSALAYVNRGVVYGKKGMFDKALEDIDYAIKIGPSDPIFLSLAYYNRGLISSSKKDYESAIDYFSRASELDPENVFAQFYIGDIYYEQKEYRKALVHYSRAIEKQPAFNLAYNNRGNTYHHLGDFSAALADFNSAIEIFPEYAVAYLNRGAVYEDMGNKDAALLDYYKAVRFRSNFLDSEREYYVKTLKWRIEVLGGSIPD